MVGLNGIMWAEAFSICIDLGLNCSSELRACGVSLTLAKDELADGCWELMGRLDDNNIIISTLALRISPKVNKAFVDYQIILSAEAQG